MSSLVERRRGSREARGYGRRHLALRARVGRVVAAGAAVCARCGGVIRPGEAWDLGHDDVDRSRYLGPEHAVCNRGAAGRRRVSRLW